MSEKKEGKEESQMSKFNLDDADRSNIWLGCVET